MLKDGMSVLCEDQVEQECVYSKTMLGIDNLQYTLKHYNFIKEWKLLQHTNSSLTQ